MDFENNLFYKLSFHSVISGHVYKATWSPQVGAKLECNEDTQQEVKDYDKHVNLLISLRLQADMERRVLLDTSL